MKRVFLLSLLTVLTSCKENRTEDYSIVKVIATRDTTEHAGKKLLEQRCYVCHNPKSSEGERIAPPMIAIKAHYITENTTKAQFTDDFIAFIKEPSEDKAKMRGAVRRFGIMPYQPFKDNELRKIAEYMYDYEIEEPKWFKDHWRGHGMKPYRNRGKRRLGNSSKTKADVGLEYSRETQQVLGKNLMKTIQKKGTLEALKFCNEKAYHLTDSMSKVYNASIKRVSDKPRNIHNKANLKELEIIEQFKQKVRLDETINPVVEKKESQTKFYYPILTNQMCLQCHGKPTQQVKPETLNSLAKLYPNDMAKGYNINEVRGIWSISFNKK